MKINRHNNKGFTLIELLATIAVLAIIVTVTVYVSTNTVIKAKEKSYQVTINNIEKAAYSYLIENSDKFFFVKSSDNTYEYQCVTVQNLIDYAYLETNVTESPVSADLYVEKDNYVYVERNVTSKAITKNVYIMDTNSPYARYCNVVNRVRGDIIYNSDPNINTWSREKNIIITYRLRNLNDVKLLSDYKYGYSYSGSSSLVSSDANTKTVKVTSNGNMYANIKYNDDLMVSNTLVVSKIDTTKPIISLGNNASSTVVEKATVKIKVNDSQSGVDYSSFTKDDLKVTVGNNTISQDNLSLIYDGGNNYKLQIKNNEYEGKVKIEIDSQKVFDIAGNGNNRSVLEPDITFKYYYLVTFNANGGTVSPGNITVRYNTSYGELPIPTRDGYTFTGWYKSQDGSGEKIDNSIIFKETDDLILYAKWNANTYTINYYQGNGTATAGVTKIGSSTCKYDSSCELSTYSDLGTVFPESSSTNNTSSNTCDHYWNFYGWSAAETGMNVDYTNGQTFQYTTVGDINLYAIGRKTWSFASGVAPSSYIYTDYQYWNPYSTSNDYLTSISIPKQTNINTWNFIGYRGGSNSASSTTTFAANTVETSQKPAYDVCRVARSVYSRTLTISYNANGGSGTTGATRATQYYNSGYVSAGTNSGASITFPTFTLASNSFTRKGYKFSKWADGSVSGTQYNQRTSYNKWKPAVTNTTVSKKMYAIWNANTITIKYDINGGELASSHGSNYSISNSLITKDNKTNFHVLNYNASGDPYNYNSTSYINITKDGYKAKSGEEWNTKADGTGKSFNQDNEYNASEFCDASSNNCEVTLYVNWEPTVLTVNLNANGATRWTPNGGTEQELTNNIFATYKLNYDGTVAYNWPDDYSPPYGYQLKRDGYIPTEVYHVGSANASKTIGQDLIKTDGGDTVIKVATELGVLNDLKSGNVTVNLYAGWEEDGYSITYNLDGGTLSNQVSSYNKNTSTFTISNPTKNNYVFNGWVDSQDQIGTITSKDSHITQNGNVFTISDTTGNSNYTSVKLQVRSTSGTYLDHINSSGLLGKISGQYTSTFDTGNYLLAFGTNGSNADALLYVPVKLVKGVTYNYEWQTDSFSNTKAVTGHLKFYKVGGSVVGIPNNIIEQGSEGDRTLTANWTTNTFTIKYSCGSGSGTVSPNTINYGDAYNVRTSGCNGAGGTFYEINGWISNGKTWSLGSSLYSNGELTGNEITLTAQYRCNFPGYCGSSDFVFNTGACACVYNGGGGGGGGSCFVAGTKVMTINGYKDIDKILVGDYVLSYNVKTNKNEYHLVTNKFIHSNTNDNIYEITIDNGSKLSVTEIHPFYVKYAHSYSWIMAKDLKVNDLLMSADGIYHKITSIKISKPVSEVYNISVDGNNNYYVGKNGILVHNKNGCMAVNCDVIH